MLKIKILFCFLTGINLVLAQTSDYEIGSLEKGQKIGIWKYYDSPENLSLVFDHTQKQIVYSKKDTIKTLVKTGTGWVRMKMDQNPRYLGSYETLYQSFQNKIPFPTELLKLNTGGDKFYLGLEITLEGKAKVVTIVNLRDDFVEKYVVEAFNQISGDWVVAEKNGVKYPSILSIPIVFCSDCYGFTPGTIGKEDRAMPCEILPQIMIQKNQYKKSIDLDNRNQIILSKEKRKFYEALFHYPSSVSTWSIDGNRVAFIQDNNIYTHDLSSHQTEQITKTMFKKNSISWIEKGILFSQTNNFGINEVMLYNFEEDQTINLSKEIKWSEFNPIYSKYTNSVLVLSAKNGSNQLYSIDLSNYSKKRVLILSSLHNLQDPHLSPIDYRIAYIDHKLGKGFALRVKSNEKIDSISDYYPRIDLMGWSPDGNNFLINSFEKGQEDYWGRSNLQIFNLNTKARIDISKLYFYISKAVWLNSGIIFEADGKIRFSELNGKIKKTLNVNFNHWSIHGNRVLFAEKNSIKIYDLDTKKIKLITPNY